MRPSGDAQSKCKDIAAADYDAAKAKASIGSVDPNNSQT
jgi:hypothetical protein